MDTMRTRGGYFRNVESLEDLREQYFEKAKILHPDHGGTTQEMQALNAEYEKFLEIYARGVKPQAEEESETDEAKEQGQKITTWRCTPEQIARMNAGERSAVDEFFEDNEQHLFFLALKSLRKHGFYYNSFTFNMFEPWDLINQAYIDLRTLNITLEYDRKSITRTLARSMYYAPVGGAPDINYKYTSRCKNAKITSGKAFIMLS